MAYYEGKRVLITGAGAGIGALMAEELGRRGAEVIVTARRISAARDVVARIKEQGGRALAMRLDVSKINSIPSFRDQVHEQAGPLDILVNNAGVVFGGEFEKVGLKEHLNTLQVNTSGLVAMTHAFMDDLIHSREANLVNISSASAFVGLPYGSTYAASKWAVLGFSDSLRLELRERGIRNVRVTTVCPSYINTGMFEGVRSPLFSPMLSPQKVVRSILRATRRGEALVRQPAMVRSIDLFRALPGPIWDELSLRTGIATSMKSWKGKH